MTTPTDRPDPGLPEAVRRVTRKYLQAFSARTSVPEDGCAGEHQRYALDEEPVRGWCCEELTLGRIMDAIVRNAKAEAFDHGWAAANAESVIYCSRAKGCTSKTPRNPYREGRTDGE